jgi:dimethylhistidine N-methyltransferase
MKTSQVQTTRFVDGRSLMNFIMSRVHVHSQSMKDEILSGLRSRPKTIAPKYLYDVNGSRLYDRICELDEYYPTRTESSILRTHAQEMLSGLGDDLCIIEIGAGTCTKGRLLLETGAASAFVPVDISAEHLRSSGLRVARRFPRVSVHAVVMDFLLSLDRLSFLISNGKRRAILYAGSSIGNLEPAEARQLLVRFCRLLRTGDVLIIGFDLKKDPSVLHRAYNDSEGVTAAFNLNLLFRLNREFQADFRPETFRHNAWYNADLGRVEMHLESTVAQEVRIADERITFGRNETIHTESSYKYTMPEFGDLATAAGLAQQGIWSDPDGLFAVGMYGRKERPFHV